MKRNRNSLRRLSPTNHLRTKWIRYVRIIRHFIKFLKSYDYVHIYEIEHYGAMKRFTNIGKKPKRISYE